MTTSEMVAIFERFKTLRQCTIGIIDSIPDDRLQVIPGGFRNNIHWQAGHLAAVEASLLYRRAGQDLPVPESYVAYFGKGTAPADWDDRVPPFADVRRVLQTLPEQVRRDLDALSTWRYPEVSTVSTGTPIDSSLEALIFLPVHEAHHLGMMTAMKKFL
jgi:uncharacterized damage-inducible protein DinB